MVIDFTNCLMLIIQYFKRTCEIVSLIQPCFSEDVKIMLRDGGNVTDSVVKLDF